jgi:FIMAH domain-containing protein
VRTSSSIIVAAIGVIAACTGDAVMTAPSDPSNPVAVQPAIRLVVIDSTTLPFAGTAADRAAGHYAFQIVGAVPAIAPGDYVAGRQGGLYLGRVLSVSQSGGRLLLELGSASWHDVYPPFKIHIPFTPGGGSAPSPYGVVRWAPWHMVTRPGQRPGVAPRFRTPSGAPLQPADFNPFNFLLSNLDLCAASGVDVTITGCAKIAAKVLNAQFSLTGGVDVGVNLDIPHASLDAFATVNEQLNTTLDFQLSGDGMVELDVAIPDVGFATQFSVAGFTGKVEVGFIISVTGEILGTTIEPHIQVSDTVSTGASLSTSSNPPFNFNYAGAGHFDAGVQVIDLGTLGVKLGVGPKFEVKVDIAGDSTFSVEADADGFVEGQENLTGLLGLQNWHVHTDAGTEAVLGASVRIPIINLSLGGQETFPGPGINLVDLWGTGDLHVASSTTGKDIFPGQLYGTSVARTSPNDPPPWFAVLAATLGVNDTHLFQGGFLCRQFFAGAPLIPPFIEAPQDCDVVATGHAVSPLSDIAWNCTADQPNGVDVTVRPRIDLLVDSRPTDVTLSVVCRSAYAVVRDIVNGLLASGDINIGGIATALNAKLFAAEAARDAGDPAGADSALVDLANQLRAQNGKHISVGADAELQAFDTLLRDCYETIVPTCSTVPAPTPVVLKAR